MLPLAQDPSAPSSGAAGDPLATALRAVVGGRHVLTDRALVSGYETDFTRRFSGRARLVVRPGSADEVRAIVGACVAAGAPIVPQGGNTGLVGGGVPRHGEVLLSLSRLTELGEVDVAAGQVTAGAGVPLSRLQERARAAGFEVGIDLPARDSATVGGLVATNAGGERVLRYGCVRSQIVGVEAVLADGSVISALSGLPKDNTGYDLTSLLAGSEGTLGIITAVRWRLFPALPATATALAAVADTPAAVALLGRLRQALPSLDSAELFYADGLDLVVEHLGLPRPFPEAHPVYLLVECADRRDPQDALMEVLAEAPEVLDAAVATDVSGRRALRLYRDAHTESINAAGVPLKLDVAVPLVDLALLEREAHSLVRRLAPQARLILFGHVNEGNLHVNVLHAGEQAHTLTDAILRFVASRQGSISAEHGVGVAKVSWLGLSRSPAQISAMRAVKAALDPAGVFNPGVLLPEGNVE